MVIPTKDGFRIVGPNNRPKGNPQFKTVCWGTSDPIREYGVFHEFDGENEVRVTKWPEKKEPKVKSEGRSRAPKVLDCEIYI